MKLADEKIAELAPEWATHYRHKNLNNFLIFESVDKYQFYYWNGSFGKVFTHRRGECAGDKLSKPIPRKPEPFDITQHEWSDLFSDYESVDATVLDVKFYLTDREDLTLNKKDAIALAKHFGLTAEDLK